jgi:hypothetical protein
MATAQAHEMTGIVEGLKRSANDALHRESPDDFAIVEQQVNLLDAKVRDFQQATWVNEAMTAAHHLEDGDALSDADLAVIRAFLISDAEHYVMHEDSYMAWVHQLNHLMDDIAHRLEQVDRESIADLRGVTKDAVRLMPDIRNYLDEKRRINQFESALKSLNHSSRDTIARILREHLASARR